MYPQLKVEISMPDGRTISPVTGQDWEGVGVIPSIAVASDRAFEVAYSQALDTLYKSETDEITLFRLEWAKKEIDAELNPISLDEKTIRGYTGKYGPRTVFLEKEVLFYQRENRPRYRLIPLGDDWFRLDDLDLFRIVFSRDSLGNVRELIGVYDDGSRDVNTRSEN